MSDLDLVTTSCLLALVIVVFYVLFRLRHFFSKAFAVFFRSVTYQNINQGLTLLLKLVAIATLCVVAKSLYDSSGNGRYHMTFDRENEQIFILDTRTAKIKRGNWFQIATSDWK
jgi:hypothetical protein